MKSICPVHSEKGVSRQYLLHSLAADYETVRVMKTGPRGSVLLLQNKQNGKRLVFRHYEGSGEVYQKLLPISCPYLPQIMEVAGENGRVAVPSCRMRPPFARCCAQSQIERKEAKPPAFFGAIYRKKEGLLCFRLIVFEDFPQYAIPPCRISARRCWKKPFPAIPR